MSSIGPLLAFEKVTKEYRRRQPGFRRSVVFKAIDSLDLAVYPGELLLITGRSGAGKSTVAQLMVGLALPTSGSVIFSGRRLTDSKSVRDLAGRRQIVFQNPYRSLSPRLTVGEIVVEPARIVGLDAVAVALLERVDLSPKLIRRYPSQLSAGQRQRVALARALSTDPDLLVLDEPSSSLDPIAAATVNRIISGLGPQITVVLISHDPLMRKAADRVLLIESGRLFS